MAWTFKNFVSDRGENQIRRWLDTLPKKARFKIDARIKYLQAVEKLEYPYVEKWKGIDGLFEVQIAFAGVMYRMLGHYTKNKEFILLVGAVEKDWQLEPRNAEDQAVNRMALTINGRNICDHFEKEEN